MVSSVTTLPPVSKLTDAGAAAPAAPFAELMKSIVLFVQDVLAQKGYDVPKSGAVDGPTLAALDARRRDLQAQFSTDGPAKGPVGVGAKKAPEKPGERAPGTFRPEELESLNKKPKLPPPTTTDAARVVTTPSGEAVPVGLAPKGSAASEFAHYEKIVRAQGGGEALDAAMKKGEPFVLALRGVDPKTGKVHGTDRGSKFDDSLVVMKMVDGKPEVEVFAGSTHPQRAKSKGIDAKLELRADQQGNAEKGKPITSVDVNGDGKNDVGMVTEGLYRMKWCGEFKGRTNDAYVMVNAGDKSGAIKSVRDLDQDGKYSAEEWAFAKEHDVRTTKIMMHPGKGGAVASVGCQNAADYEAFADALGDKAKGWGKGFSYLVVNAAGPEAR